jgi:hypothetical protein
MGVCCKVKWLQSEVYMEERRSPVGDEDCRVFETEGWTDED